MVDETPRAVKVERRGGRRSTTRVPGTNGDGWGGEARAPGQPHNKRAAFEPGNTLAAGPHVLRDPETADRIKLHILHLAQNAEREETQLAASQAFLNRIEGMPVARNLNINRDAAPVEDTRATVQQLLEQTLTTKPTTKPKDGP